MATYSQMLKEVQAMTKRAQAKLAEITGEDPDNMPGAENDKDVTLPKEDPEVNDGSMGPESARSTEGKGDDRPITAGDLFESDESIVNPEEKPLETDDANAKEASAKKKNIANDILSMIHGVQTKKAEDEKSEEDKSDDEKSDGDSTSEDKADDDEEKSASLNLELTKDVLAKLACAMLAEKEGSDLAEKIMAKQAGADQAKEVFGYISGQEKAAEEYIAGQRAALAYMAKKAQDLGAGDADQAIDAMLAESPEAAADAAAADPEVAEDAAAEDAAADEAVADAAADAATDEEMLPEDAVAEVLLSQLQSGDLTEDDLAEIVMELAEEEPEVAEDLGLDLGVDAGASDEGAAGEPASEPEAEPAEEPVADEKAASVKGKQRRVAKKAAAKQVPVVQRRAQIMSKVAAASKLLVAHLGK